MKKIPTIFMRDESRKYVSRDINPECQWVFDGEGVPTRKWDGTCTMLDEAGKWWARREVKPGRDWPNDYVEVDYDNDTGKSFGWEPIEQSGFATFHAEALVNTPPTGPSTYELMGPKINGNPEDFPYHVLVKHGTIHLSGVERSYDGIHERLLENSELEGIVFWHPDGRMAKIKARDFPPKDA